MWRSFLRSRKPHYFHFDEVFGNKRSGQWRTWSFMLHCCYLEDSRGIHLWKYQWSSYGVFHVWSFLNNWVVRDSISYRSGPLPRHAFASEIGRVNYSRRIRMVIACSWVSSFTSISIDVLFNFQFGEIILLCIGYSSLLVLTIVYIKLFSVARYHAASTHSQSEVATHMSITSMAQKETQPSKFSMYTSFPCCVTVPSISLRRFWLITSNPDVRNQAAIHVTAIVVMLNSSLNPIVFGCTYKSHWRHLWVGQKMLWDAT